MVLIFGSIAGIMGLVYFGYYSLCLYTVKNRPLKVRKDKNFRPSVSFVIPTWNEESTIEGKLKNTLKIKYPKKKLEIIVIDSGSTDNTRKIVKKFKKVKLISEDKRNGKANALNKVFKHCKGEIIVISDSDSRLKENVLLKSVPYFYDPTIGAITGRQKIPNPSETTTTKIEKNYRNFFYLIREAESRLDSTFIFDGPLSIMRKNLLENIFQDSVADDSEIALRVRKKGYKTLSIKEIEYTEYAPKKIDDRTKQKQRRAQGLIQIMTRFFRTFFLNPNYGLFGLVIFPTEFFMHVISPILLVAMGISLLFLPVNLLVFLGIATILLFMIRPTRTFVLTFLHSQYSCIKGMLSYMFQGPSHSWEKIHGTRRYRI
jgi:cellulose synthase/poly-beta-1,6-N-acetylglucosamine synthase-like glycosyltransferase